MTRIALNALCITLCFTGLISGDISLSVWQTPENITSNGTDENITCHIKVDSRVKTFMIKWRHENQTEVKSGKIDILNHQSNKSGSVCFNATLNLLSIRHSGMYYCAIHINVPTLINYEGNGTYVYVAFVVPNLTTVATPTTTEPLDGPPNPFNDDMLKWSLLSGLGFVLLIVCISCFIHIHSHYKGSCRIESRAKETLVDATESPSPEAHEAVVYAAIKIPQHSVKSRNETSAPLNFTSETCTQDSVTYSEVHIKKRPKDEG